MTRAQDAEIAVRLFGWRWMLHDGCGGYPKQRVALFPPDQPRRVIFNLPDDSVDVTGRQHEFKRFSDWDKMVYRDDDHRSSIRPPEGLPNYTTEANADYMVLKKVLEVFTAIHLHAFEWKLHDELHPRLITNKTLRENFDDEGRFGYTHLMYKPGDYSRAVLAVWESEQ